MKLVLAALLLLLFSSSSQADDLRPYYGLQLGYVHSSALSTSDSAYTSGFEVGLQADIPFTDWFSVQPGLRFIEKGFGFTNEQANNVSIGLNYLELPLLAKFKVPTGTLISPFVYLGPYVAILTGDTGSISSNPANASAFPENLPFNFSNGDIERFDWGFDVGIGLEAQVNVDTRCFLLFERTGSFSPLVKNADSSWSGPVTSDYIAGVSFAL